MQVYFGKAPVSSIVLRTKDLFISLLNNVYIWQIILCSILHLQEHQPVQRGNFTVGMLEVFLGLYFLLVLMIDFVVSGSLKLFLFLVMHLCTGQGLKLFQVTT